MTGEPAVAVAGRPDGRGPYSTAAGPLSGPPERHPSGDAVLAALAHAPGPVGDLVRAFPGRALAPTEPAWLDDWFRRRAEAVFAGEDIVGPPLPLEALLARVGRSTVLPVTPVGEEAAADASVSAAAESPTLSGGAVVETPSTPSTGVTRLLSLEPRYFRGFRTPIEPIRFDTGLTVIDGENSAGKTSLAEACEWLLTGQLSRRSTGDQGAARELANCVGNHFRPAGEETWVEARLELADGRTLTVRRVLEEDYGSASTSRCRSRLHVDGAALDGDGERAFLQALFGGCPPLLMQHTLRRFVHSGPADRRAYFEQLLQLDELTTLIEKAVVGARAPQVQSPTGSVALGRWGALKTAVRLPASATRLKKAEQRPLEEVGDAIAAALPGVAAAEFGVPAGLTLPTAVAAVRGAQQAARQQAFPLLDAVTPKRTVDDTLVALLDPALLAERGEAAQNALDVHRDAREAAAAITAAEIAVAGAVATLTSAGLLPPTADAEESLTCPVCLSPDGPSLSSERLARVRGWDPIRAAVVEAGERVTRAAAALAAHVNDIARTRRGLMPRLPAAEAWNAAVDALPESVQPAARAFRATAERLDAALGPVDTVLAPVWRALVAGDAPEALRSPEAVAAFWAGHAGDCAGLARQLSLVVDAGRDYAAAVDAFGRAVGTTATDDQGYTRREQWLAVAQDTEGVARDLAWERAKATAQLQLKQAREVLIELRQGMLEQRRGDFSAGMTAVWTALRSDRYSSFSAITIPEPRGKGYPIELELKARLDDGQRQEEVDALRVFSESQVNVLAIAAFVTRARLLGHRVLVFDDPVQSMDDAHFFTFAARLVAQLLDAGIQVVVLTHNDAFARQLSYAHYDRHDYATARIAHARKSGCRIERDSRRVAERLRRAEQLGEAGDLTDAWHKVRLALERLYLVAQIKHGPSDFRPVSWEEQTLESMFNAGFGAILEAKAPVGSAERMKRVQQLSHAGAHDKAPPGLTDLLEALTDVRAVAGALNIRD